MFKTLVKLVFGQQFIDSREKFQQNCKLLKTGSFLESNKLKPKLNIRPTSKNLCKRSAQPHLNPHNLVGLENSIINSC